MTDVRQNYDQAERLFRKALELDPKNPNITRNFASFMRNARKNHDEAERLYRKALELDPENPHITGNLANFMTDGREHDLLWSLPAGFVQGEQVGFNELGPEQAVFDGSHG